MSGWGSNQPTGLIQAASVSIGSANTAVLIAPQPGQLRLLALAVSSIAVSPALGIPNGFAVEDVVNDSNGVQYLAVEIGLPTGGPPLFVATNSLFMDLGGIVVPASTAVRLVNGGAAGSNALRRCSASLTYIIL